MSTAFSNETEEQTASSASSLDADSLMICFSFLSLRHQCRVSRVCRFWRVVAIKSFALRPSLRFPAFEQDLHRLFVADRFPRLVTLKIDKITSSSAQQLASCFNHLHPCVPLISLRRKCSMSSSASCVLRFLISEPHYVFFLWKIISWGMKN